MRTIALLNRVPGLIVLREALLADPGIALAAVYTHGRLPPHEGGGERAELADYREACAAAGVPLHVLDLPEAKRLDKYLPPDSFDLFISLSWRCILAKAVLDRARVAAVNFHRGALPDYPGADCPVRRAIEAGERRVAITAHHMVEKADAGPVIATVWLDIEPLPAGVTAGAYAETVRARLHPLYAPLARLVLTAIAV